MPNKDSFTFSDKLRKSKSVPLSKRLPSIVGGQNKQKRTLVQRAQRDLPFILVAAAALLLLPFLSKNGSNNIPTPSDFGWANQEEPSYIDGDRSDIAPADFMKDPLEMILRPRSDIEQPVAAAPETPKKDAIGGDTGSSPRRWNDNRDRDFDWNEEPRGASTGNQPSYAPEKKPTTGGRTPSNVGNTRKPTPSKSPTASRPQQRPTGSTRNTGGTPASKTNADVRNDYDKQIAAKKNEPSTVEKFKEGTKSGVRNSVVRKATEINRALRVSQMPGSGANAGVSHALPLGQQTVRTSAPFSPRIGVRPAALQPMDAKGTVGRSMTGENLYAEAARSINAMNAGRGAKANLLAAQMRDVDGALTPGADGGTFGGDGSPRPGAGGGGPNNNNGYKVERPWWWDMMKERNQRWWELFQYKWREMLWSNIYDIIFNGGKQIANCLIFGSKDVDVSHMFGEGAGDSDYICKGHPELGSLSKFLKVGGNSNTTQTKEGGSQTTQDNSSALTIFVEKCEKAGGSLIEDPDSDTGFFKVRAKCLGLDVLAKKIKSWGAAKDYSGNCDGVNNDPMQFTYTVTKNNKEKKNLEKKTVIALVARVKEGATAKNGNKKKSTSINGGDEIVVYAQKGNVLAPAGQHIANDFLYNNEYKNCELTKLVALVPSGMSQGTVRRSLNAKNSDYQGEGTFWYKGQITAGQEICKGKDTNVLPLTANDVIQSIGTVAESRPYDYSAKTGSYMECPVYALNNRPGIGDKRINNAICVNNSPKDIDMKQRQYYSAIITNPDLSKFNVYAILAEEIDGEDFARVREMVLMDDHNREQYGDNPNVYKYSFQSAAGGSEGFHPGKEGFGNPRTDYNSSKSSHTSNDNSGQREKLAENVSNVNTTLDTAIKEQQAQCDLLQKQLEGLSGDDLIAKTAAAKQCQETLQEMIKRLTVGNYQGDSDSSSDGSEGKTARGSGRIYWIMTKAGPKDFKVKIGDYLNTSLGMLQSSDFIEDITSSDYCDYKWCDEVGTCDLLNPNANDHCFEGDKVYTAYTYAHDMQTFYIKLQEAKQMEVDLGMKPCTNVCYDFGSENKDIFYFNNGKKGNRIGSLNDSKFSGLNKDMLPQCPLYCKDGGRVYSAVGITVNNEQKFLRTGLEPATPDVGTEVYPCDHFAWYDKPNRQVFEINPKWETLPIIYDPNIHRPDVYNDAKKEFDGVIDNPQNTDKPRWELLPQLITSEVAAIQETILKQCNGVYRADYLNASIVPMDDSKFNLAIDHIVNCFNAMKEWEEANGSTVDKKLYIYGYASHAGDNYDGCDGGSQSGPECNLALSEDRNLYMVKKVKERLNELGLIREREDVADLNGFTNTNSKKVKGGKNTTGVIINSNHRYAYTLGEDEFNLVSYPCGSEGASSDAENERYIVITLANAANNTGRDFCANRVTEDDFKDLNITLCSTLPTVTNTASSTGGYLENYMKKNKKNNNIANNSNFTFTNYAPNSVCNMLNDLNYINPQISFPFSINSLGSGELDLGETFDPKELMELQQLGASFQIDPKCVDPMCSSDCITRAQNIVDRVNKLLDNNKQEIVSGECVKAVKNKMDELDRSIGTQNSVNLGLNGRDFNNGTLRPGVSIPLHK